MHLQDPRTHVEAERALLAFRDSSATLPACLHIVQHSTLPDARFQALLALRHSALASWPHLSAQERTQLRAWALQACLGGAGVATGVEGAIQQATRALAALLLKRQWSELPEQEQRGSIQVGGNLRTRLRCRFVGAGACCRRCRRSVGCCTAGQRARAPVFERSKLSSEEAPRACRSSATQPVQAGPGRPWPSNCLQRSWASSSRRRRAAWACRWRTTRPAATASKRARCSLCSAPQARP